MEKFFLQIITPQEIVYNNSCYEVNLPGSEGRFSVLNGHMNLMSLLKMGIIELKESENVNAKYAISSGYVEIIDNQCNILVERCIGLSKIDLNEIQNTLNEIKFILQTLDDNLKQKELESEAQYLELILNSTH